MRVIFHISGEKIDYSITIERTGWGIWGKNEVGSQPNSLHQNHFWKKQM